MRNVQFVLKLEVYVHLFLIDALLNYDLYVSR